MRKLHGAVHWRIECRMHGRNHRQRSSSERMSSVQVRNWKTRWSTCTAARRLRLLVNGPYSRTPLRRGVRVISTRGYSSRVRICRYGNDLSSFSRRLNRGWMSLISRDSYRSASTSVSVWMKSMSAICLTKSRVRSSSAASFVKYVEARLRRLLALPT